MSEDAPAPSELRDAAARGVRWSLISRPTIELLQLGSIVILARLVAPAEFGRYAVALIAQEVANVVVAGGLSNALVQRKKVTLEHEQAGIALGLLAGVVMGLLTMVAATVLVTPVFGARTALFVRLMAPLCLISSLTTVPMATLRRRLSFRRVSEIEMLSSASRVAVCVALALAGLGGEALVLGVLVGAVVGAMFAWFSAPPPSPRLRVQPARELLSYGLPVSLATIGWVGFSNVDYAVIGARLGAVPTGLYYRAYTIAVEYQSKISVVMTQVGFPVLARTRDSDELTRLHRHMVRMLTIVLFPMLALLAITAPVLVPFVFGARWASAVVPVQILALGGASTLVIDAAGTVLMAKGRARALLGYGFAHFIIYGITVLLVVQWGIVAVAIDASIVHSVFLVVAYVLILQGSGESPLRRLWDDVAPASLSAAGMAAIAVPASIALRGAGLPAAVWLLVVALIAVPAYLLVLRTGFPSTWRTQRTIIERILPARLRPGGEAGQTASSLRRLPLIRRKDTVANGRPVSVPAQPAERHVGG